MQDLFDSNCNLAIYINDGEVSSTSFDHNGLELQLQDAGCRE